METPVLVDHRQGAQAFGGHESERLGDGLVGVDGDVILDHGIADARGDIRKELRLRDTELFEDEGDPFVERAGAGRMEVARPEAVFQGGVSDGRAHGIHVGIAVADDDGFHGYER